jgi:nickel-dependent lactate racemase
MDLNLLNANVGRLLTNIWAVISFLREFAVDGAKDVSITYINADGSESVKTFPNIAKQIDSLEIWKNEFMSKHSINDGNIGCTHFNIATKFTSSSGAGYVHIKLPIRVNTDVDMFNIALRGHSYGQSSVLDAKFVGYSYGEKGLIGVGVRGVDSPTVYTSSDGYVVCRVSLYSIYYTTAVVDSIFVGNGRAFNKGDITVEINTSTNI